MLGNHTQNKSSRLIFFKLLTSALLAIPTASTQRNSISLRLTIPTHGNGSKRNGLTSTLARSFGSRQRATMEQGMRLGSKRMEKLSRNTSRTLKQNAQIRREIRATDKQSDCYNGDTSRSIK